MAKLLSIDPVVLKGLRALPREQRVECLLALCDLVEAFGRPHIHAGLGPRKLGEKMFDSLRQPDREGAVARRGRARGRHRYVHAHRPGYLHPACATEQTGDAELLEKIKVNTAGLVEADVAELAKLIVPA